MSYKIIHEQFWTDPKIKSLKMEDKFLFLYLITNPYSHSTGIYYIPKKIITINTGMNRGIDRSIKELSDRGLISYDNEIEIVFIRNMLKYQSNNKIYNEKQKKGIAVHLSKLHNTILIKEFLDFYKEINIPYEYTPIYRGVNTPMDRAGIGIGIGIGIGMEEIVKRNPKNKTTISDSFTISERVKKWAEEKGYKNLQEHLESFISKCKAKGYEYIDWDSAFMEAIRGDWAKVNIKNGGNEDVENERRLKVLRGD